MFFLALVLFCSLFGCLNCQNTYHFIISGTRVNWHLSEEYCNSEFHSHLGSFHSQKDHNWIRETLHSAIFRWGQKHLCNGGIWIGLRSTSIPPIDADEINYFDYFSWSDNSIFNFSHFSDRRRIEPNDFYNNLTCVAIATRGGWFDTTCEDKFKCFICNSLVDPNLLNATTDEPMPTNVIDQETTHNSVNETNDKIHFIETTAEIIKETTEILKQTTKIGDKNTKETDTKDGESSNNNNSNNHSAFTPITIILGSIILFVILVLIVAVILYFYLRHKKLKFGVVQVKDESLDREAYANEDIVLPTEYDGDINDTLKNTTNDETNPKQEEELSTTVDINAFVPETNNNSTNVR